MKVSAARLIFKNTLAQGFGKIINLIFSLWATVLIRQALQRSGFGEYIFITALITILVSFSDFGTHLVGVREASNKKGRKEVLGNVILLRSLFSLLSVLVLITLFFIFHNFSPAVRLITVCLLPALSFMSSLNLIFHTWLKFEKFAVVQTSHSLLFFIFAFLGKNLGKGLDFFLLGLLISNLLPIIFFSFYYQIFKSLSFRVDRKFLKEFFQESLPMGGILVLFSLYSRVDSLLLKALKGDEAVGIYGLAYRVYENLTLPAAFLMNSYLPLLSREAKKYYSADNFNKLKRLLKSAFFILLTSALFLILITFIASNLLITILVGQQTDPEVLALRLLLPAILFAFLNHLTGYTLLALGKQRKSFFIACAALIFNLLANLIFIPRFSFMAAAVIMVLTEALVFTASGLLTLSFLKKRRI